MIMSFAIACNKIILAKGGESYGIDTDPVFP